VKPLLALVALVSVLAVAGAAFADSAPIGPLPAGPISSIAAQRGELVAVALPGRSRGRVWRIARPLDPSVLRQVSEANVGRSVVLVFRASGAGVTTISMALTKSDTASKALESRRYRIRVR
jgi:hypothetical protein